MPSSAPPQVSGIAVGTVVGGKLRIVRVLGEGGMGTVYEVEHELTKHRRALKVLHAGAAQIPHAVERFLREASAAGRIGNPHIAETFDAGRLETGDPYLLMELLAGETLDDRRRSRVRLELGEIAELVGQACEGVQAAHDAGIVHRDLKPENLFVTAAKDGTPFVKLLDFGISKFDADRTGTMGVTAEGMVMGTPYYMSPEQVRGMAAAIDGRTDVYALGVILYECAANVRPYEARSLEQLAILIHEGKPAPLAERVAGLPAAFCDIVHRAMNVDRDRRFPTAAALGEALAPFRSAGIPGDAPTRAVLRPSGRPPLDTSPTSSARPLDDTAAALADTATALADTRPGEGKPARARRWGSVAVVSVVAAAAIAVGVTRLHGGAREADHGAAGSIGPSAGAPTVVEPATIAATTGATTAVASSDSAADAATSATLTPLIEPTATASASARSASSAGPASHAPGSTSTSAGTAVRAPPTSPVPSSKSRVDQHGLAGDNPFK